VTHEGWNCRFIVCGFLRLEISRIHRLVLVVGILTIHSAYRTYFCVRWGTASIEIVALASNEGDGAIFRLSLSAKPQLFRREAMSDTSSRRKR